MTSYKPGIATVPPPTLEKQLEVLAAARALVTPDDEFWRRRRQEIAAIRRELGELAVLRLELQRQWGEYVEFVQEQRRRRDPRLRSHVIKYNADQPRVPAGSHGGGQWTSSGGAAASDARAAPATTAPPGSQRGPQYAQAEPATRTDATDDGGNVSAATAQQYPDFGHDVYNTIKEVFAHIFRIPRNFPPISASEIPADSPKRPEPLVDSSNQPILDDKGNPILRPADLPPEAYVQAGIDARARFLAQQIHAFNEAAQSGLVEPSAMAGLARQIALSLMPFLHGGSFDAERTDSNYVREYRHYTSIALGIFMAAAGVSKEDMLAIADTYASMSSKFGPHEDMDPRYTHSAKQDIEDNLRGYDLYESGRIHTKK